MSRLTIGSNIPSLNAQRRFGQATNNLSESFTRLSSGLRINQASDDAAGLSVASILNIDKRVTDVGIRNINDGISYLNVAESALNELSNIVTRISELAEQGANGTLGSTQREALQQEVTSLESEYNRIIKTTSFNGNKLLTGTTTKTTLQGGYGLDGQLTTQTGDASLGLAGDPTRAGLTSQVSTNSSGVAGNAASLVRAMSADGRYVAFESTATNLVAGDANGVQDAFVKDTLTGITTRISTDSSGVEGNATSSIFAISGDGRYVAFYSTATNLVTGDTNGVQDSFIKDTLTGVTTRISTDSSGVQGNATSFVRGISGDGRYVAFYSAATNLVAGDTNGADDAFIKDTLTGITTRVSTDSSGVQGNAASTVLAISGDGRYVAFYSVATNLVAGDTNAVRDSFVKDTLTGVTTRISTDSSGVEGNGASTATAISADGRYVAFYSNATNLVAGDTNARDDSFIKDTHTGVTTRITLDSAGAESNGNSRVFAISADGRYAAFSDTTNGPTYLRDLSVAGVQEISGMIVSNQASSRITLDLSKKYQAELSNYKAGIGASLSRATTFLNTLQVQSENYAAASSQIMDVDVAQESSRLTGNRIVQQAAASVLGQANLQPRIVLGLLEDLSSSKKS